MEKNSVKQTSRGTKTSSPTDTPKCPLCGKPATRSGQVLKCPEHGSEPWE